MNRWGQRLPWLFVAIALVLRLGFTASRDLNRPLPTESDEVEYDTYAWNLAQGHGYRGMSPDVSDPNHVTAYRPPGPSLVYAAIYLVVGHRPPVVRVFNCLLSALACLLIVAVGRRTVGELPALAAAGIWAIWPTSIFLSGTLLSEQVALVTLLALVLAALAFGTRPRAASAALVGLVLGINLVTHASRLFVVPVLALWVLVQFRGSPKALALSVVIPIIASLVLAPWILRNESRFGAFIPFSTGGGSALLQGNNRIVATEPEYYGYNIWDTRIPEYRAALQAPNNELARDQIAKRFALEWISSHKGQIVPMAFAKIRRGWTPFLQPQTAALMRWTMLLSWGPVLLALIVAFVPMLVRLVRAGHPGWILHLIILHVVMINAIFFGYARYRYVVEPYCILLAAAGLFWLINRRTSQTTIT